MSGMVGPPQPQQGGGAPPPPGPSPMAPGQPSPQGPMGVPPGAQPNPAFAQWMQAYQQQQTIVQENTKRTAQFEAACDLIKKDGIRGFKLDIEADSTIAPDEQAEQMARVNFLQQIVPLIQQITPIAQGNPAMAELASEIAMFAVRGFRVARTLEESFEKAFQVLGQMPPAPPKGAGAGSHVDPQLEQAKLMAQVHDTQTRAQTDMGVAQTKAQTDQLAIAQKSQQAQLTAQAAQQRAEAEAQHSQAQLAIEAEKMRSSERMNAARTLKMTAASGSGLV